MNQSIIYHVVDIRLAFGVLCNFFKTLTGDTLNEELVLYGIFIVTNTFRIRQSSLPVSNIFKNNRTIL
jgi:hypothetical protein